MSQLGESVFPEFRKEADPLTGSQAACSEFKPVPQGGTSDAPVSSPPSVLLVLAGSSSPGPQAKKGLYKHVFGLVVLWKEQSSLHRRKRSIYFRKHHTLFSWSCISVLQQG